MAESIFGGKGKGKKVRVRKTPDYVQERPSHNYGQRLRAHPTLCVVHVGGKKPWKLW